MTPGKPRQRTEYTEFLEKTRASEKKAMSLLGQLIRFQSIASRDRRSIVECADYVEGQLEDFGFQVSQFQTQGSPIVFGEKNVGSPKTLLFYHHYDVQPEDPVDMWKSSPWELSVRDGRAYGRGAADNKGPFVANLLGVDALERVLGRLPINVKFVVEGEEEIGSVHLGEFTKANKEFLRADGCVMEFLTASPGIPSEVCAGMKGTVHFELMAGGSPRFARTDVHVGYSGVIPSAAWRLIWALNSLKDEKDNILLEGFKELVREPSYEDRAALEDYREDVKKMLKNNFGLDNLILDRSGMDLLEALYMKPSASIIGMSSGYQGPGSKGIIPSTARAKVNFQLVPDLTARKVEELLRAHLNSKGFDDIEVHRMEIAYNPSKTPISHPFIRLVHDTSREVALPASSYVLPIAFGAGPAYLFTPYAPVCFAWSHEDAQGTNFHAPNENWPLSCMVHTMAFVATFAERLSLMGK